MTTLFIYIGIIIIFAIAFKKLDKTIPILLIGLLLVSCENKSCQELRDQIYIDYQKQIILMTNELQKEAMTRDMYKAMEEACN